MPRFKLGKRSRRELVGVDPKLVAFCERVIELTPIDVGVYDGLRTREEQEALVASGSSHIKNSKHLIGRAVDLVPFIAGKYRWDWDAIYQVVTAAYIAADELELDLIWGGVWDRAFLSLVPEGLKPNPDIFRLRVEEYAARRKAKYPNKKVFIDGPHFQLMD